MTHNSGIHPEAGLITEYQQVRVWTSQLRSISLLWLLLSLPGCAHERFVSGHGDVGRFIIQQAVVRCGIPEPAQELPPIPGRWRYSQDDEGVVVQLPRHQYPAIELLLRQAFGEPRFGPMHTKDGGKLGIYRLTTKGGVIQFGYDPHRTQVIVIRPLSQQEFNQSLQKAMQDDRFWKNMNK